MKNVSNGSHSYGRFDRGSSYGGEMSLSAFNGLIGVILLYGFGLNAVLVKYCSQYFVNINPWVLVIGYFALGITGIIISKNSDNPFISFIGYNLVVIPVGVVLSICLQDTAGDIVLNTCIVTAIVTAIMMIASMIFPKAFLSMGKVLFIALVSVIVVELLMLIFGIAEPAWLDAFVALLFCAYIGYDWAKAQEGNHTADEAVDACVGLYLDIINLFIRILSLSSRRSSSRD